MSPNLLQPRLFLLKPEPRCDKGVKPPLVAGIKEGAVNNPSHCSRDKERNKGKTVEKKDGDRLVVSSTSTIRL